MSKGNGKVGSLALTLKVGTSFTVGSSTGKVLSSDTGGARIVLDGSVHMYVKRNRPTWITEDTYVVYWPPNVGKPKGARCCKRFVFFGHERIERVMKEGEEDVIE